MGSFFISHSSADREAAQRVRSWLSAQGHEDLFLSSEPGHDIASSAQWERELWLQLRVKRHVVFLSSAASVASPWCFAELALARSLRRPIFPIDIGGGKHPLLRGVQAIKADNLDVALSRLAADLQRLGIDAADDLAWDATREPYPGLRHFGEQDAGVFFGRRAEIDVLIVELEHEHLDPRPSFVTVVGASGSGKSSLVLAGLVPRLRPSGQWLVAGPAVPGTTPTRALAGALVAAGIGTGVREVRARLRDQPASLLDDVVDRLAAKGLPPDRGRALLVLDQFEQAFTLAAPGERQPFFAALAALTADPDSPMVVCATLRSEFLTQALADDALAPCMRRTVPVRPIGSGLLRDVVSRPAERAVIDVEPELVDRIVADASGPDALPLLSYTLQQLVEKCRADRVLTVAAYDDLGGVDGTLRRQADAALADLRAAGWTEDAVLDRLLRLVTIEPGEQPTSRPVQLASFPDGDRQVVERFRDPARLIVSDEGGVRLAHEALLRVWEPLRAAVEANRAVLEAGADLRRTADQWERAGRTPGHLLTAERLDAARRWRASAADVDPLVESLIEASDERARAESTWRADQLGRRVLAELDSDPERAQLLALAAVDEYAASDIALRALHEADRAWRGLFTVGDGPEWYHAAWFLPDGRLLTASSYGGALETWDGQTGAPLARWRAATPEMQFIGGAELARDGNAVVLAVGSADEGRVELWDVVSETCRWSVDAKAEAVGISADGRYVAVADRTGLTLCEPPAEAQDPLRLDGITAVAVRHELGGVLVATGGSVRRLMFGHLQAELESRGEPIFSLDLSRDEALLVRAGEDGVVAVHHLRGGMTPIADDLGWAWDARWSPDDSRIVVLSSRGGLVVTDKYGSRRTTIRRGSIGRRGSFDPTGTRVVAVGDQPGGAVWDVREERAAVAEFTTFESSPFWHGAFCGPERVVLEQDRELRCVSLDDRPAWSVPVEPMTAWAVDPLDRLVAVAGREAARVLDGATGDVLATLSGASQRIGFSADGAHLWAADDDGRIAVWSVPGFSALAPLEVESEFVFDVAIGSGVAIVSSFGLRAYDLDTGTHLWTAEIEGSSHRAAFAGDVVAISAESAVVTLLEPRTGSIIATLEQHEKLNPASGYSPSFQAARWSPDGTRLLLSGTDGTASVWNARTRGLLQAFVTANDPLSDVDWSLDGERVLALGRQRAVVWDAPSQERLIERARERTWRSLTDAERAAYGLARAAVG